jgi:lysophospholipase L1-like esterase
MLIRIFNKVYQFILGNKVLRFGLYFILLLYPFCFYFLLKNRGVNFGDITNLIIPIYVIVFIDTIYRLKLIRNSISENIIYISKIYFIIELLLVIIKPTNIYDKYIVDEFILSYDYNQSNYYHLKKPFEEYQLKSDEFNFNRKANSIGIPEKEIIKNKPKNITRILCLGDSFTEGDGADKDSSYVTFLNRSLQQKFQNIEVINGGRCGSDPFFDFKLLQDILIKYQPDIILQSFTTNDLFFDMVKRGGNERFQQDSIIKNPNERWWTPIYIFSYTSRILIQTIGGYDKYLIKQKEYPQLIDKMKGESTKLFQEYNEFAKKNHTDLIVFSLPFKWDFSNTDNNNFHQEFSTSFSKFSSKFYNLQPCYEDEIKNSQTKFQDYYWKIDGHHNAKGYEMMAKCLEEIVTPIIEKRIEKDHEL